MNNKQETLSALWSLWGIQESLLQTYRTIFITSESILLSLSAAVLTLGEDIVALLLLVPGLMLLYLWRGICGARARDVTFVQTLLAKVEAGEVGDFNVLGEFKRYQDEYNSNRGYCLEKWCPKQDDTFLKNLQSTTRVRMDAWLPNIYTLVWLVIILMLMIRLLNMYAA